MVLCNITFKQPFLAAPVPLLQDDKFLLRIYGILCSKEPAKIGGFRLIFSKALPKYQPLPPPLIFFFKGYQQKIEALQFLSSLSRGRGRGCRQKMEFLQATHLYSFLKTHNTWDIPFVVKITIFLHLILQDIRLSTFVISEWYTDCIHFIKHGQSRRLPAPEIVYYKSNILF